MFKMTMGFKSRKAMSPLSLDECGTPGKPPCDIERTLGSTSSRGEQDGVPGTFTTTNFQTDFEIKKPSSASGGNNNGGGKFSNPQLPNQTYEEFKAAEYGTPGKTNVKYKPATPSYGQTQRSDTNFVPDQPPPPPPKTVPIPVKTPILPPPFEGGGRRSRSLEIGKTQRSKRGRRKRKPSKNKCYSANCS